MLLAAAYVRLRDVLQIWTVALQILFYASPIFYVVNQYPERIRELALLSPLAIVFTQMRHVLIDPDAPSAMEVAGPGGLALSGIIVVAVFALGLWAFRREAPRMAENV